MPNGKSVGRAAAVFYVAVRRCSILILPGTGHVGTVASRFTFAWAMAGDDRRKVRGASVREGSPSPPAIEAAAVFPLSAVPVCEQIHAMAWAVFPNKAPSIWAMHSEKKAIESSMSPLIC